MRYIFVVICILILVGNVDGKEYININGYNWTFDFNNSDYITGYAEGIEIVSIYLDGYTHNNMSEYIELIKVIRKYNETMGDILLNTLKNI